MQAEDRRNKIFAGIATLVSALLILIILCATSLYYEWPPKDEPIPEESEILFGGEYVMLGDVVSPAYEDMSSPQNVEETSAAEEPSEPENLVSTDLESDMKAEKAKEEEEKARKREEEAKKRREAEKRRSQEINNSVANHFGKGRGQEGSPTGNAETGSRMSTPGYSLKGRTLESWGTPSSRVEGTIVIKVRVNPQGKVIEATYRRGDGSANANMSVRQSCINAALKSRFSVAKGGTNDQIGTITWRFE